MNDASSDLTALVNQLPAADPDGKLTGPEPAFAEKLCEEVLNGGRESVLGLVGMLVEPGKGEDWKARYLLHCVAVYVGRPDKHEARTMVADALASQLCGTLPKAVQAFLVQELQVAGRREATAALGKLLLDEELCEPAAQALLAIRDGAAEQFRAALPKAQGKTRLTILQALAVLADTSSSAAFRQALSDPDREVRLAAALGLANGADAASIDALLGAADVTDVWQRDQMTHACLLLAEKLLASGKSAEARRIYQQVRDTRSKPEDRHARQAAEIGLAAQP